MSERERAIQLLNAVPEFKMNCVIAYMQGIIAGAGIEEVEPDEWDLEMIARAKAENDDEGVTLEDFAAELGDTL